MAVEMAPRVCILGQANPFAWHGHYVRAFRRCCDVLTIGPNPDPEVLRGWGRAHLAHMVVKNDIEASLDAVTDLYQVLPGGWLPDLVVSISGGGVPMFTHTENLGCPSALLSIDTWQCLMEFNEAIHYDLVFAAQRSYIPHLRATGSRHVYWLPLGCAPEVHYPVQVPKTSDISFVGAASMPVHRERARLLHKLAEHFTVTALERVHGDDMCRVMAGGRLTFNHSAVEDLNMRIFEALAMACPLLTNRTSEPNGLLELFEDGRHLIVYDSDLDLIQKARAWLADEAARNTIAQQGREEVLARHTYDHRVQTVLNTVKELYPAFGTRTPTALTRGDALADYLSAIPGLVLDMGMALKASKYAMRRRGTDRFLGWSPRPGDLEFRRGSYDEVFDSEPARLAGNIDTVALSRIDRWPSLDQAVGTAHRLLCEGGRLVVRFSDGHFAAANGSLDRQGVADWFHDHDFHIVHLHTCADGSRIATARKRTRTLRDVVIETFTRLQVPGADPQQIAAMVPPKL